MRDVVTRLLAIAFAFSAAALPMWAQSADFEPSRLANGKPDLNGIWQALNTANYDIERHMARPAMMLRDGPHGPLPAVPVLPLGAVGAVPGGMGVVEGLTKVFWPEASATIIFVVMAIVLVLRPAGLFGRTA